MSGNRVLYCTVAKRMDKPPPIPKNANIRAHDDTCIPTLEELVSAAKQFVPEDEELPPLQQFLDRAVLDAGDAQGEVLNFEGRGASTRVEAN